jgi:Zn-dependent protease with chaperone function
MFKNITLTAIIFLTLTNTSLAQTSKTSASLGSASTAALAYFDRIHALSFDSYLKSIRPGRLSPELKAKLITILPKKDIISPSAQGRDKLAALEPILKYYARSSVLDLKVIRMGQAVVLFLAGAAVVISEEALDLLTEKELQAIIAHELGHEYFWNEWQQARLNKQYEKMQEIELRCDGMAVITMNQLGLDPSHFISAITRLAKSHGGPLANAGYYPPLEERIRFIRTMIEVVKARSEVFGPVASKG